MRALAIFFTVLILASCTTKNDNSEPTIEEITNLVQEEGNKISAAAQQALGSKLQKALMASGPVHAVQFCNTAAFPILDTLKTDLKVSVRRASLRVRNPKDKPSIDEQEILEKYTLQLENGVELKPVVKVLDSKQILFTKPIMLNNPMCLNCHGQAGSEVQADTYDLIMELYPEDDALNHKLGDLRGIWSLTFAEEDLISYLKSIE